jgi:prepilin signal peptidase PulO-like enzyme (type II secretory pathway)
MMGSISITSIGAVLVALIASYTDIKTGKIFNILTFPAAAVGILTRAAQFALQNPDTAVASGFGGAINGVLGWITAVFIMGLMKFFLRQLGHGDTKLMGALGAFIGPGLVLGTFLYFCIIYAVCSLAWLAMAFPWRQFAMAQQMKDKSAMNLDHFNEVRKRTIPIAPFIAGGLFVSLLLEKPTLQFFGFIQ